MGLLTVGKTDLHRLGLGNMATVLDATQDSGVLLALPGSEDRDRLQLLQDLQRNGYLTVKVVLEYCVAAVLFVLTGPIILVCALLVRLTSRGPAFYSQTRLGLGGRPYL